MSLANLGGGEAKANRLGPPPTALASGFRVFLIKAPRMASVSIRAICGRNILVAHGHPTFHILNIPPPNIHAFSRRAQPHVHIRHSQRVIATT